MPSSALAKHLEGGEGPGVAPPGLAELLLSPPEQEEGEGEEDPAPAQLPRALGHHHQQQQQLSLVLGMQEEQERDGGEGQEEEEGAATAGAGVEQALAHPAGPRNPRPGLLHLLGPPGGPQGPEIYGAPLPLPPPSAPLLPGHPSLGTTNSHKRSVNMTECVAVPTSEHVAEIVGRQGCKIKALRAKTNTYIKTPLRGEEPVFIVTGRKEDVEMAKWEILAAAEHFSMIRATRNKFNDVPGSVLGPPNLPGHTTIQVRVPYRVVGLVVGPKGITIKRIQQQTHTYIVTPSRDKEPVFEVTGMPENVDRAREEIEAHITMRTGSFIDINADNDFHSNGTDVCLDLLTDNSSGSWSKAPNPSRRSLPAFRSNNHLGSSGTEPYFDGVPHSPFASGGSFPFSEPPGPTVASDECDFGFDCMALDLPTPTTIWSPLEPATNPLQAFSNWSSSSSINGVCQRRNSSLSSTATPRQSPTLQEMEHPLVRRIQSDPVNALSWLPTQSSLTTFSNSTGYSSSSSLPGSISATSGSPTDSSSSSDRVRKNSRDCMVCFESEVIAALVPCGHNLFCMECAMRICGQPDPECPACHTPATQAIHIFS